MATEQMQLITDITLELTGDERLYMASAKQGDKRTRFIRIALTNNGKVFTIPTGYIAIANIKKPDKHICLYTIIFAQCYPHTILLLINAAYASTLISTDRQTRI